jgi:hypothetical protein
LFLQIDTSLNEEIMQARAIVGELKSRRSEAEAQLAVSLAVCFV